MLILLDPKFALSTLKIPYILLSIQTYALISPYLLALVSFFSFLLIICCLSSLMYPLLFVASGCDDNILGVNCTLKNIGTSLFVGVHSGGDACVDWVCFA